MCLKTNYNIFIKLDFEIRQTTKTIQHILDKLIYIYVLLMCFFYFANNGITFKDSHTLYHEKPKRMSHEQAR